MMVRLVLLSLCGWVASAQEWNDDYWRRNVDGFSGYLRLFRPNACGYDSAQQRYREEGDRWERGSVRYECRGGERVAVQCLDKENSRWMSPGEQPSITLDGSFGRSCALDSQGYMRLVTSHCAMDGRTYRQGEEFQDPDGKYWYRCVGGEDETQVEIEIAGCITEAGRRINVGDYYDDFARSTWYYCERKESRAVAFCGKGCLDGSERRQVGDQWTDFSGAQKLCQRVNGRCDIVEVSRSQDPAEETYAEGSWDQRAPVQPAPQPNWSYSATAQQTYQAPLDGYCSFSEGGNFKFFLPHNTYTTTFSSEYQADVYVVCRWNAYNSAYEAEKFQTASYSDADIRRENPGLTWTNDIRYD